MTGQPLTLRKSNMRQTCLYSNNNICIRVMEYYALHYLKCSHDTYDPERGVVQLPQALKVHVYTKKIY